MHVRMPGTSPLRRMTSSPFTISLLFLSIFPSSFASLSTFPPFPLPSKIPPNFPGVGGSRYFCPYPFIDLHFFNLCFVFVFVLLFGFVLFCFALFCFVLFCFVLLCFVLFFVCLFFLLHSENL